MEIKSSLIAIITATTFSLPLTSCSKSDNDVVTANGAANRSAINTLAGESWRTIEAQNFMIDIPFTWNYQPLPGIDGYNGIFMGNKDSMRYEYSISPDTFKIDPARYSYHYEIVDGRRAKIISGAGYGIAIDDMKDASKPQRRFVMMQSSKSGMDEKTAMQIIRSIRFE